jgi:hypothetical protein
MCGFSGTSVVVVVDNFGRKANGSSYDSGRVLQTFTAYNGRGVSLGFDAGHLVNLTPVTNADGSTTFVTIYDGLNLKTQAINGPVLQQNTGRVQVTSVYDASGNLISFSAIALAGPNSDLTGAPDCSVVGPYLAGV